MNNKLREVLTTLDAYPQAIKSALLLTKGEKDIIDVVGTVKANERKYKDMIGGAVAELDLTPNVLERGTRHEAEVKNEAKRSFNTPNLMRKLQAAGFTLMDLIQHDVVRLQWQWRNLERFTSARGIDLDITNEREISPLGEEDYDVSALWNKSKYPRWT